MAIYLQNLPSFNKENFSNFQSESSQICPSKKTFLACSPDYNYTDEQLIVNSQCNIIIQYLEKQAREKKLATSFLEKSRKRDINNVLNSNESIESSSTSLKRRKLIQNSVDNLDDSSILDDSIDSNQY
ncbi:unnamed protein product [Brachionus calyciflorus]|uniref:DET1- and DDB1-associated protein 1 domain-containing protein n=1 Tax=Brachionus calyciflorus TaxID=104777 RepID=A0A813MVZ3_9BILA|nr:unnamed protein product [Brachionus calyciflorus]